jgi:penicillin-binding protein 1A
VLKDLEERYGTDVVHHAGLKVFTTLDPQLQAWAADAVQNGLEKLDQILRILIGDFHYSRPFSNG